MILDDHVSNCYQGLCLDITLAVLYGNLRGLLHSQPLYPFGWRIVWPFDSHALHASSYKGEKICIQHSPVY